VFVTFEWKNPLQIPLEISHVFFECESNGAGIAASALPSPSNPSISKIGNSLFDVEVLSGFTLQANEKKQVTSIYVNP
jgi:hypothetical protein